jgi:RNA polymerase sigma factor (sigma-70 family)
VTAAGEQTQPGLSGQAAALFVRFRGGDEAAMADLVQLLTPIMWHAVRAQGIDRDTSSDVVQTTWLSLVRSADSIAEPQALLQWLLVSARREAWRVGKRDGRVEAREFEADDLIAPAREVPEELVLRSDGDARLWQHIAALSQRCQELLRVIAFAARPDYSAVAKSLGMPVGSIGPTRGRCLAKLKLRLADDPEWDVA